MTDIVAEIDNDNMTENNPRLTWVQQMNLSEGPEEWRTLALDETVMVSSWGRVKRKKPGKSKYSIVKLKPGKGDYVAIQIKKKSYRLHRLIAEAFELPNDDPENKVCVDHRNNIHYDNRLSNLRWCTVQENSQWAADMGLQTREINSIVIILDKENKTGTMYTTVTDLVKDYPNLRAEDIYAYFSGKRKHVQGYTFVRMDELIDKRRGSNGETL